MRLNATLGAGLLLLGSLHAALADVPAMDSAAQQSLRSVGVMVEKDVIRAAQGQPPDGDQLAFLQRMLADLRNKDLSADKYQAVWLKFAQLANGQANSRRPAPAALRFDREAITPSRGSACSNALGLSLQLPVSVALAERGSAWLKINPQVSQSLRISAQSDTADAAIEIFPSCQSGQAVLRNDDSIGLDASLSLAARRGQPLFVHVLNSGAAGNVLVSVQGGDGNVAGTVRDASSGNVIAGAYVDLFATNGAILSTTATAQDGTYTIAQAPGDYYVISQSPSYATQIYSGVDCAPGFDMIAGCDAATASIVTISAANTTPGIDFALDHGHSLQGQIRDTGNNPLAAHVVLYNAAGAYRDSYSSDQFGHFRIPALPPATYKLAVEINGFNAQMYDGKTCSDVAAATCNIAQATPIVLSSSDLFGIDFEMAPAAAISGRISLPNGLSPADTAVVAVPISPNTQGGSGSVASDGTYRIGPLQIGSYRLHVTTGDGYFPMAFPGIDCATYDCRNELPGAAQVAVSRVGEQVVVNMQLHPIPPVTGHVSDATTGAPLAGVEIDTSPTFGFHQFWPVAVTDSNGDFSSSAFSVDNYYVWARSADHTDQLYSGIVCETDYTPIFFPCDLNSATVLRIAPANVPAVLNFQLVASGAISGTVTFDAGPGSHLPAYAIVVLYDATGKVQDEVNADSAGRYVFGDVPAGIYHALAFVNEQNAISQLWPGINCTQPCTLTLGQPISVAAEQTVEGIDFQVALRSMIVGRVTRDDGAPIPGAVLDVFSAADASYQLSTQVDADGYYMALSGIGDYFVATEAGRGFVDQVYQGISCPIGAAYFGLCSLAGAQTVSLNVSKLQPTIVNFALQRIDPIFAGNFE